MTIRPPRTEAELEDLHSTPSQDLVDDLAALDSDLVALGAGGKVGPTLCLTAQHANNPNDTGRKVIAASRWSETDTAQRLEDTGVIAPSDDLPHPCNHDSLPAAGTVLFMVSHKPGTTGRRHPTWWTNSTVSALAANRYRSVPTVVHSSGNVYAFVAPITGGCTESDPMGPMGAYAQSCLARQPMPKYAAVTWGTPMSIYRLNDADEFCYGMLADIAADLVCRNPIDATMGAFNVLWQPDPTERSFRSLAEAYAEVFILNDTGAETVSTHRSATALATRIGIEATFISEEGEVALLSIASLAHTICGDPGLSVETAIDWVAAAGRQLGKTTKFQLTDRIF